MEFEKMKRIAVFSGSSNPRLSDEIAHELGISLGNVKLEKFANGEIYARYLESVRGADVFIVQSVCSSPNGLDVNDNLMELLIMIDAAKRASAHSVSAVITHYGYARQDRKAAPREPITAKLVADLLTTAGADNIIAIDLHQDAIQGFFDKPVNHMTAMPIFVDYYKAMGFDPEELCVVSPDVGSVARARTFAQKLHMNLAIVDKRRQKANQCEVMNVIGDVEGKDCILFDDMVDTAGSICNAAKAIVEVGGANSVYACASHGVLSGPALERINNSVIKEMALLNTIPEEMGKGCEKIKYLSVAPMFAEAIERIYQEISIAKLFN